RIGQQLGERAKVGVGRGVGLAPGARDRIVASWRRLTFPAGEPDPRRPEHVVQIAGNGAKVRVDGLAEFLHRHPVDCGENLVVCPVVVRDELAQLVAVRHVRAYIILEAASPCASAARTRRERCDGDSTGVRYYADTGARCDADDTMRKLEGIVG